MVLGTIYNSKKNWPMELFHFVFLISWNDQKDVKTGADWQIELQEKVRFNTSRWFRRPGRKSCLLLPGCVLGCVVCIWLFKNPIAEKVSNQILGYSAIPGRSFFLEVLRDCCPPPLHPVECRCVMATGCSLSPKFCTKDESLVELQGS